MGKRVEHTKYQVRRKQCGAFERVRGQSGILPNSSPVYLQKDAGRTENEQPLFAPERGQSQDIHSPFLVTGDLLSAMVVHALILVWRLQKAKFKASLRYIVRLS